MPTSMRHSDSLRCLVTASFLTAAAALALSCEPAQRESPQERRAAIAAEVAEELERKLDLWYPRVIDREYGGYLTNFTADWQQEEEQEKMIVTQSRHLWTLSRAGSELTGRDYTAEAERGFEFLRDRMWDGEYGGFHQTVTRSGEPLPGPGEEFFKTLYGNVFAIYGLAAYYGYTGDPEALDLARKTFDWLEEHARDPAHGGYFQNLERSGRPVGANPLKDYNSGIHTLEAFYELYGVWPDERLRERLREMFLIIRDLVTDESGYLKLYFEADWTHISFRDSSEAVIMENLARDHVTPGHDIETAYLLYEAALALDGAVDRTTLQRAKRMVDHTLDHGWDEEKGGIYDVGYHFPGEERMRVIRDTKTWWAQAEALNPLLMMADYFPDDERDYFGKFAMQWDYIRNYLIDHEHGGWFHSGLDKRPDAATARKSHAWKGNYHTVRSLMEVLERLGGLP